jgi:hypothetical protein
MDTWRLVAGIILMLVLLAAEVYLAREVLAIVSKLLG